MVSYVLLSEGHAVHKSGVLGIGTRIRGGVGIVGMASVQLVDRIPVGPDLHG